jgi:hypothetical protein
MPTPTCKREGVLPLGATPPRLRSIAATHQAREPPRHVPGCAGPSGSLRVTSDREVGPRGERVTRGHPASESCVDSTSITTAPPTGSTATTGPTALKSTRSRTRPSNVIDRSSSPCSSCRYRSTVSAPLGAGTGNSQSVHFHSVERTPVCAEPQELNAERLGSWAQWCAEAVRGSGRPGVFESRPGLTPRDSASAFTEASPQRQRTSNGEPGHSIRSGSPDRPARFACHVLCLI